MSVEQQLMELISQNRVDILNYVFKFLSYSGEVMIVWLVITFFLLYRSKKLDQLKFIIPAYLITFIISQLILKNIIQRPRPFLADDAITTIVMQPLSYSMPSSHSASSFVAATLLSYYFPKYRIPFFILAFSIAFSRVYIGVHYPSDIFVGALLGIGVGLITVYVIKKVKQK